MVTESALEALRQAVTLEREGIRFYADAARKVEDAASAQMFLALATDEKWHQKMLIAQLSSLKAAKGWHTFPRAGGPTALSGGPALFPRGKAALDAAISRRSTEIDAIRFGLDIENRSFEFYFKAAQESDVAEGRAMYSFLAEIERGHFGTLIMRLEGLIGPLGWTY